MKKSITLFKYIKLLSYLKKLQGLKASESLLDIFYLLYIASLSYKKTSKTSGMRVKKAKKRETCCFTSKELDEETGLYYFGARYFEPQISKWMSPDPAFGSYLPRAGQSGSSLPGQGGVYNPINLNPYSYSGNNPLTYKDPDGNILIPVIAGLLIYKALTSKKNTSSSPQSSVKNNPTTSNNGKSNENWILSTKYREYDKSCSKYWGGQSYHTGEDWQVFDSNNKHISRETYFRSPASGVLYSFASGSNTVYIYDKEIGGYWELSHGQDNSFKFDIDKINKSNPKMTIAKGDLIALIGNKGLGVSDDSNSHLHIGLLFTTEKAAKAYIEKYGDQLTDTTITKATYRGKTFYYAQPLNYGKMMKEFNKK